MKIEENAIIKDMRNVLHMTQMISIFSQELLEAKDQALFIDLVRESQENLETAMNAIRSSSR